MSDAPLVKRRRSALPGVVIYCPDCETPAPSSSTWIAVACRAHRVDVAPTIASLYGQDTERQ